MMANPIKPKRSFTANSVPVASTDISSSGELLINWADGKLFTKDASGNLVTLTVGGSGGGGGGGISWSSAPASPTSSGTAGDIARDSNYVYVCTASSTWKRAPIKSWDPNYADVSLLLHANNTLVDSSQYSHVLTAYGAASASGAAKFGVNSLSLDGDGDYFTVPSNSAFSFSGDFTIEAWIKLTAASSQYSGAYYGACLASTYTSSGANPGWQLRLDGTSSGYDTIYLYTGTAALTWSASIVLNTWHHVAVCRSGSSVRAFLDGTQCGSTSTNSDSLTPSNANALSIGRLDLSGFAFYYTGLIDELRLTKAARYTANFTAPSEAFPDQ